MLQLIEKSCYFTPELVGVNVGLACVDAAIALFGFAQLIRIRKRNYHLRWTRQKDDEDEEDDEQGFLEALLKRSGNRPSSSSADRRRTCFPLRILHVGSHQKIVILVTSVTFVLMMTFAVLIGIGIGDNPINSSNVALVYVKIISVAILLSGIALACFGLLLCMKMRKVKSERASSEIRKVAGLAIVSVLCFTASALVALLTDTPVLQYPLLFCYGL